MGVEVIRQVIARTLTLTSLFHLVVSQDGGPGDIWKTAQHGGRSSEFLRGNFNKEAVAKQSKGNVPPFQHSQL